MKRGTTNGSQFESDFTDMLNQMFGAGIPTGGSAAGGWQRRTPDAIKEFEVTLEELYKGRQVKMMSKRNVICSTCKGYTSSFHSDPK
jgi:DnaJ homolog subfamily A member 2